MRILAVTIVTLLLAADLGFAQRGRGGGFEDGDRQREGRGRRFEEGGERRGPEGGPRGGRMGGRGFDGPPTPEAIMDRVSQALSDRLELDSAQQAEFDEIVAVFREDMQIQAEGQATPQEIFAQMREARDAGDEAAADELREQMRGRFSAMGDTMSMMLDEVEPILNADQVNRLGEFRERMEQRRREMNPREAMEKVVDKMRTDLDMSADQQEVFDGMVEDLKSEGENLRNRWREMGPLMREARDAREAGDDARVEEIRAQLEEMRGSPGKLIDGFFEEVSAMLDPDQREKLAALRAEAPFANREGRGRRGERAQVRELEIREVLRAAKRLDVNSEQREKINDIESEAGYQLRQAGRDQEAAVARQVKRQIEEVLDAEQKTAFNRLLGTENEGRRGRDRGDRRERGNRAERGEAGDAEEGDRGGRRRGRRGGDDD